MKLTLLFLKRYLIFLVLLAGIFSCKKETIIPSSPSFNYFPVEIGRWVEYDVDSIFHGENDDNNDDSVYTFHFQIREEIDSSFINGQGQETQIVKRYKRNSSMEDWSLTNVWTQTLTLTGAYRIEDNVAYHKLAFPINSGINWNGNDANTLEEETYSYEEFHVPTTIGGVTFDSTLTVVQIEEENFIERIYGKEKYATGVGMIFKQRDNLGKRNGIVVKGLEYKMTLRDFGPR
ncbi:MAG TPA: hypothetical protein PKJ62_06710 [Bacteroidia bacterium]|nr:hypothetical protein [Bacteroidia bacterium]HNS11230.1 hypothetical protein [Bacteroidia bacterium]